MSRPIGYYVHHHGDGHHQRAMALAGAADGRIVLLGTGLSGRCAGIDTIDLPDDRMAGHGFDGDDEGHRPASLHYAPLDHAGIRHRVAKITEWIARTGPALMIVDVSVEIAMLARLASVPTVYVRLSGRRFDRPHLEAYRGAAALLAPFHALLDDARTPQAIRRRTCYAPGIATAPPAEATAGDGVLGVIGRGGGPADGDYWAEAARATPGRRWRVIGPCTVPRETPGNLELLGWVDDPARMMARAGVIVGAAGDGLVGAVIAARRPFVCIPEPRPFGEQHSKADRLEALHAAIVARARPTAADWPALIGRAEALRPEALAALDIRGGAGRTARWLCDIADRAIDPERLSA